MKKEEEVLYTYFSCPTLSSQFYFGQTNPEIVKRWSNEVQEAVQSRAALVQFHALGLLHQVCLIIALIYILFFFFFFFFLKCGVGWYI
jgi:hypothetical protein